MLCFVLIEGSTLLSCLFCGSAVEGWVAAVAACVTVGALLGSCDSPA